MKRIAISAIFLALILSTLLFLYPFPLHASAPIRTLDAVVIRIVDGDTVIAETKDGTILKVRLYGIDAPELPRADKSGQPFAEESSHYLASLVFRKEVRLDIWAIDRYRRMVAMVWIGERNINLDMITAGMAEAYIEYLKHEPYKSQFLKAERNAQAEKVSIWSLGLKYERPSAFKTRMIVRSK